MSGQPRTASSDPEEILAAIGRSWIWTLVFAGVTLVAGIIVLVWPQETARVFAIIVGLQFIVIGIARFVTAFAPGRADTGSRILYVLLSLLSVLAGVLCLRHQLQAVTVLALIIGVLWLIGGIVLLFSAIADHDSTYRGFSIGAGSLSIVAGIVVLGFPTQSVVALARLVGLWLLLLGLFDIGLAIAMRVTAHRARTALRMTGA